MRLRCHGLLDGSHPGASRQIKDEDVERIVTMTLEAVPRDATLWSTRTMAKASGMIQSAVGRIWRAFELKPPRAETFRLSKDPLLMEKVRDAVGLYMDPSERAVVFLRG